MLDTPMYTARDPPRLTPSRSPTLTVLLSPPTTTTLPPPPLIWPPMAMLTLDTLTCMARGLQRLRLTPSFSTPPPMPSPTPMSSPALWLILMVLLSLWSPLMLSRPELIISLLWLPRAKLLRQYWALLLNH